MTIHTKGSATSDATSTIGVKWNTPISGMPRSTAIDTTRILVEVPMVVAMPPISEAALSGISVFEAAIAPRMARCTKIGISSTSTGVLLTPIDSRKVITSENSSPSWRLILNNRSRNRAAGSSAPVTTSPRPMIISAQIVISA